MLGAGKDLGPGRFGEVKEREEKRKGARRRRQKAMEPYSPLGNVV